MRQFVSAVELRFQQIEANEEGLFDTTGGLDEAFAPLIHTHQVADILDFVENVPQSIFDLNDVAGTPDEGFTLLWDATAGEFVPGPVDLTVDLALSDLNDVNALDPEDNDVLTWDGNTLRWVPSPVDALAGPTTFAGLDDTDLTGQAKYDLVYNADGTNWAVTGEAMRWISDANDLSFSNAAAISWFHVDDQVYKRELELIDDGTFFPGTIITGHFSAQDSQGAASASVGTLSLTYIATEDMVDGALRTISRNYYDDLETYFLFIESRSASQSAFETGAWFRIVDQDGVEVPGSEVRYRGFNSFGFRNCTIMTYLNDRSKDRNVEMQMRRETSEHSQKKFRQVGVPISALIANNSYFDNYETGAATAISSGNNSTVGTGWTVPVTGQYMVFTTVRVSDTAGLDVSTNLYLDVDGTQTLLDAKRFENNSIWVHSGQYILNLTAGQVVRPAISVITETSRAVQATAPRIAAFNLDTAWKEAYVQQSDVADTMSANKLTFQFTAQNSGDLSVMGYVHSSGGGGGTSTDQQIRVQVNSGGFQTGAYSLFVVGLVPTAQHSQFIGANQFPTTTIPVVAGDVIDIDMTDFIQIAGGTAESYGYVAYINDAADAQSAFDIFSVGVPEHPVLIDASQLSLKRNVPITWQRQNLENLDLLILGGDLGGAVTGTVADADPSDQTTRTSVSTSSATFTPMSGETGGASRTVDVSAFESDKEYLLWLAVSNRVGTGGQAIEGRFIDQAGFELPGTRYQGNISYTDGTLEQYFLTTVVSPSGNNFEYEMRALGTGDAENLMLRHWGIRIDQLRANRSFQYAEDTTTVTTIPDVSLAILPPVVSTVQNGTQFLFVSVEVENLEPSNINTVTLYALINGQEYRLDNRTNIRPGERHLMAGYYSTLDLEAGTSVQILVRTNNTTGADATIRRSSIGMINLDTAWIESYPIRSDSSNVSPQVVLQQQFTVQNAGRLEFFGGLGIDGFGFNGGAKIEAQVNSGGFQDVAFTAFHDGENAINSYKGSLIAPIDPTSGGIDVIAGDVVDVRINQFGSSNDWENYSYVAYVANALDAETFTIGDRSVPTVIDGTSLEINSNTSIQGDLSASGNTDIGGSITVGDGGAIVGSFDVTGSASIGAAFSAVGAVDFSSTLDVTGAVTLGNTLSVTGSITGGDGLTVTGDVNVLTPLSGLVSVNLPLEATVTWDSGTYLDLVQTFVVPVANDDFNAFRFVIQGGQQDDAFTIFRDDSSYKREVTGFGSVQWDSAQFKFASTSILFNGTTDYLTAPDDSIYNIGSDLFTVGMWVRFNSTSGDQFLMGQYRIDNNQRGWAIQWQGSTGRLQFIYTTNGTAGTFGQLNPLWSPAVNTWYFISASRDGSNSLSIYVDGTRIGNATVSATFHDSTAELSLGARQNTTFGTFFNGWMEDPFLAIGKALYTGATHTVPAISVAIDPPAGRESATDANWDQTNLLIQGGYPDTDVDFVDASEWGRVVTANGTVQYDTAQFKFATSSILFDGNSDYLSVPNDINLNPKDKNFTADCWIRFNSVASAQSFWSMWNANGVSQRGWGTYYDNTSGQLRVRYSTDGIATTTLSGSWSPVVNTWYFLRLVIDTDANTLTFAVDGTNIINAVAFSATVFSSTAALEFGNIQGGSGRTSYFDGWAEDLRIYKNYAGSPSLVPTESYATRPPNGDPFYSDVALLIEGGQQADASTTFNDNSVNGYTITTAAGSPEWDDAQRKFAETSIVFDGSTDALSVPDALPLRADGKNNLVVECWIRLNATGVSHTICDKSGISGSRFPNWSFQINTSNVISMYLGTSNLVAGTTVTGSTALTTGVWYHIAGVYDASANDCFVYLDGVLDGSNIAIGTVSDVNPGPLRIGDNNAVAKLNGWISDLRISSDSDRYIREFNPPWRVAATQSIQPDLNQFEVGNAGADLILRGNVIDATAPINLPSYTDAERNALTPGADDRWIIFNETDGQLNIYDGTNWTLPDGTTT